MGERDADLERLADESAAHASALAALESKVAEANAAAERAQEALRERDADLERVTGESAGHASALAELESKVAEAKRRPSGRRRRCASATPISSA